MAPYSSVTADHLERALQELREGAGELTGTLLGARPSRMDDPAWSLGEHAVGGAAEQPPDDW